MPSAIYIYWKIPFTLFDLSFSIFAQRWLNFCSRNLCADRCVCGILIIPISIVSTARAYIVYFTAYSFPFELNLVGVCLNRLSFSSFITIRILSCVHVIHTIQSYRLTADIPQFDFSVFIVYTIHIYILRNQWYVCKEARVCVCGKKANKYAYVCLRDTHTKRENIRI